MKSETGAYYISASPFSPEGNQLPQRKARSSALFSVITGLAAAFLFAVSPSAVRSQDATWALHPVDTYWNNPANWSPQTVPDGVATFGTSDQTEIDVSDLLTGVDTLVFSPGADAFTIRSLPGSSFLFEGSGINNTSTAMQTVTVAHATDGTGGSLQFLANSTISGRVTLVATGGLNGNIRFLNSSKAGTSTIFNNPSGSLSVFQGFTGFYDQASAASATITNAAAQSAGVSGGQTYFQGTAQAGSATIICNGANFSGAGPGSSFFVDSSSADNAILLATGGTNGGGGGVIKFEDSSTADRARVVLSGNASLDLAFHAGPLTLGSLEGDGGDAILDGASLRVGSNNLDTVFAGQIQSRGSFNKIGTGTLKLSGDNTYSGGTTLSEGALAVGNRTGSGTGLGPVHVNGGTLAGTGVIAGAVTIGRGNGAGALLAPSQGVGKAATLTLQNSLTFKADATYGYRLNLKKKKSDLVLANGVTIESGAQFSLQAIGRGRLRPGKVATVINNTAATPINGAFANLPDGAVVNVNGNNLQASYSGGDGNDLTLTVVP